MDMADSVLESFFVRYARGDRDCEQELHDRVLRYARRWVGDLLDGPCHRSSVDDVVNEIVLQVLQQVGRGDLPGIGNAVSWLRTISVRNANNYFRNWYRRGGKVQLTDPDDLERHGVESDVQHRLEILDLLEDTVSKLKDTEKKIVAGIMAGWGVETMLEETGLSRATFFRRKVQLLKKLGAQLAQLLGLIVAMCVTSVSL